MTDPFHDPASPDSIKWEPLKGSLLLITPSGYEQSVLTMHGTKDAVRAEVVVLDGALKGEQYADTLIFPGKMIGQLRSMIGKRVIGRLGLGVAQPGKTAPWVLTDATEQDKQLGKAYLSGQLASAPASSSEPPF